MSTYRIVIDITTGTNPQEWNWDNFLNLDINEAYAIQSIEEVE